MRVARYFIAVVAIASVVSHFAAPPLALARWPFSPATPSDNAQQPTDDVIVDQSVQQAAWQGTKRPASRANSTIVATRGAATKAMPNGRKGALFHGQELRMPELPFARNKSKSRATGVYKRPLTTAPAGTRNMAREIPQAGPRPIMPQQTSPSRFHAATGNQSSHQSAPSRPLQASPQVTIRARAPLATSHAMKASSHAMKASPPLPQETPSVNAAPQAARTTPNLSNGEAEQLIAQAHQWSTAAQSEGDFSRIIETCQRAKQSGSNQTAAKFANDLSAWALNRRGQLRAEAGRDQEAILDFDEAIRSNAGLWRALHNRGVLLAQAGHFEKAFDDFNCTIKINPEFAKAYSNRAALFMVADNLAAASGDYKRAIELDASLQVAHRGYARVCHLIGRHDEAAIHYDLAVQQAPNDAFATTCRADLLADMGRYVEATAAYERAIALEPKSAQALSGSAWLMATCPDNTVRKPALAVGRAKLAIEVRANKDAADFDTLAAAQASAGDFTGAVKSIRTALELASVEERDVYQDRLAMYRQNRPFRIAPVRQNVTQAGYEGE